MGGTEGIRAGLEFPDVPATVSAELQHRKLQLCGIDPALYGDRADITFLGLAALDAMAAAGMSLLGMVHMSQIFRQYAPVRLGQPLTARGHVAAIDPIPRGEEIRSHFDYADEDGRVVVQVERSSLRPSESAETRGPGAARVESPSPQDGFSLLWHRQLAPERVSAYSSEAGNLIHSDPDVARQYGFRAPIAAGLMGIHFMMEALAHDGVPAELELAIRFRRPMFWDDQLSVMVQRCDGRIDGLELRNPDGRPTSHGVVTSLTRG